MSHIKITITDLLKPIVKIPEHHPMPNDSKEMEYWVPNQFGHITVEEILVLWGHLGLEWKHPYGMSVLGLKQSRMLQSWSTKRKNTIKKMFYIELSHNWSRKS